MSGSLVEVGDGVQVGRGLLAAVAAVEVGADAHVPGVAGELADVVDVIDQRARACTPASCGVVLPRIQPGTIIQASSALPMTAPRAISALICSSVNCRWSGTSARQLLWLAQTRAVEVIERLPEAVVGQMRGVEDDAEPLHLRRAVRGPRGRGRRWRACPGHSGRARSGPARRPAGLGRRRAPDGCGVRIESAPSRLRM